MASKNKKAAAKKKNEKKNRQKAALAAKENLKRKSQAGPAAKKKPAVKDSKTKPGSEEIPLNTAGGEQAKHRKKAVITAVCGAVLVLAAVLTVYFTEHYAPFAAVPVYTGARESSVNAKDIGFGLDEQLEKVGAAKTHGDKKAFGFYADGNISIGEGDTAVPLMLGNIDSNKCDFIISVLDKGRKIIYRSMGLAPGRYLPAAKLFETLPAGEHRLEVYVAAYDTKTFKKIGVQRMRLNLTVRAAQSAEQLNSTQKTN